MLRQFFFNTTNAELDLTMLGDKLMSQLDEIGTKPEWFMQDGAPNHIMHYLSVIGWITTLQTDGSVKEELWSGHQDPQT
jgi:hypothetical protein